MAQQGFNGCPTRRIVTGQDLLQTYLPAIRPNAEVLNIRPRPDFVQMLIDKAGGLPDTPGQQQHVEAYESHIRYDVDEHSVDEILVTSLLFITQPGMDTYGGMNGFVLLGQVMSTIAMAAVDAKADPALLMKVADTLRIMPDYEQRMA